MREHQSLCELYYHVHSNECFQVGVNKKEKGHFTKIQVALASFHGKNCWKKERIYGQVSLVAEAIKRRNINELLDFGFVRLVIMWFAMYANEIKTSAHQQPGSILFSQIKVLIIGFTRSFYIKKSQISYKILLTSCYKYVIKISCYKKNSI